MKRSDTLLWKTLGCIALLTALGCDRVLIVQSPSDGGAAPVHDQAGASGAAAGKDASTAQRDLDAGQLPVSDAARPHVENLLEGNPASCPDQPPQHMDPCDIAQGTVCAYLNDDPSNANQSVYAECTCMQFCGASAATLWACEGVTSGRVTCPATQPESGSSCFGKKGQSCHYPIKTTCDCPAVPSDDTWHCQQDVGTGRLLKAPTGVDAAKPVKDLSDSERQAWCSWFVEQPEPGFPALPEPVADDQGFYTPNGCFASSSYVCGATSSQDLPQSACVANLALSTCEQPVSFLTQCVQWMRGAPGATRGCGGYLQAPGCNGTIVTAGGLADTNPPGCRLRIE